jgi:hypothetical protein
MTDRPSTATMSERPTSRCHLSRSQNSIAWIVTAPPGLVQPQVTITPLQEQGWP